jgi:hypothetical protein
MNQVEFENPYSTSNSPSQQQKPALKTKHYIVIVLSIIALVTSAFVIFRINVSNQREITTIDPNDPRSLAPPEYVQD